MDKTKPEAVFIDISESLKSGYEKRVMTIRDLEVREKEGENETPKIVGYAAVFNELSEEMWGFREMIAPGAFSDVLDGDVRATYNHDPNYILGRSTVDTLRLKEDEKGLKVEIDPPDTAWARDLLVTMKRGDVNQMSFAFRVELDDWAYTEDEVVRTIISFKELSDVSVVAYPAYPQTSAEVRSKAKKGKQKNEPPAPPRRDLDRDLRLKRMMIDMGNSA